MTITLYAPWLNSLKGKRSEIKRLMAGLKKRFNVSAAETAAQDDHKNIVIGIVYIAGSAALDDSICESILDFFESATDAEITEFKREKLL